MRKAGPGGPKARNDNRNYENFWAATIRGIL